MTMKLNYIEIDYVCEHTNTMFGSEPGVHHKGERVGSLLEHVPLRGVIAY